MNDVIFITGNGNISYELFEKHYISILKKFDPNFEHKYIVSDFRGTDTLAMEWLKTKTKNVTICCKGLAPRYMPDTFKTYVKNWKVVNCLKNNRGCDEYMLTNCNYLLGYDQNTDSNRISGTMHNLMRAKRMKKIILGYV